MAKYLPRKCPRYSDYFGIVISEAGRSDRELPITAFCAVLGYALKGWRVVIGGGGNKFADSPRLLTAVN